jgi:sec-independent protein translocase protein TatB
MIEISLGKMVLLALIALIVLGPEKLPGAARTAGALLRRVRSGWDNVRAEVERELEIEEIKRSAREAVAGAEAAQQQVKETLKQAHDPFAQAAAMVKLQPVSSNTLAPPADKVIVDQATPDQNVVDQVRADDGVDALRRDGAMSPGTSAEKPDENHAPQSAPVQVDVASESDEGLQSELPLDAPPLASVMRKDRPHGNA